MAVSQFRQAVRHKQIYSSESDYDQISHASIDSAANTTASTSATGCTNKALHNNADLISCGSDSPNIEERASTGTILKIIFYLVL